MLKKQYTFLYQNEGVFFVFIEMWLDTPQNQTTVFCIKRCCFERLMQNVSVNLFVIKTFLTQLLCFDCGC